MKKGGPLYPLKSAQGKGKLINKPKQTTEKEKELIEEIGGLKKEVLMLRCNLNPAKIEEEIRKYNHLEDEDLISMLHEQVRRLQYTLQRYESNDVPSSDDYRLDEEKKTLKSDIDCLKTEMRTLRIANDRLVEERKTLQKAVDRLEKENKALHIDKDSLDEGKKTRLQNAYDSVGKEIESLKRYNDDAIKTLEVQRDKIKQMEEDHNTARKKNPISQIVEANMMDDNPNIPDLSDENRPTKLAEKYSELYDNEWTDAYEEVEQEGMPEQKVIQRLYHMLLEIFAFCQKMSDEYSKNIKSSVLSLPSSAHERPNTANIGVTNKRQLKELQKCFSPYLAQDVFKHYVKSKKLDFSKKGKTEIFTRKCIEICWLMSCQDPPFILDTANVKGEFDGDKFRTYTKSGKSVDYVVWPPLMLHKDGPLLCMGVAQGK